MPIWCLPGRRNPAEPVNRRFVLQPKLHFRKKKKRNWILCNDNKTNPCTRDLSKKYSDKCCFTTKLGHDNVFNYKYMHSPRSNKYFKQNPKSLSYLSSIILHVIKSSQFFSFAFLTCPKLMNNVCVCVHQILFWKKMLNCCEFVSNGQTINQVIYKDVSKYVCEDL